MSLKVKKIFLKENVKNIFQQIKEQGVDTTGLEKRFENLFLRVYSNEIGYYRFKQNNIIYQFIILPKTIDINSNTKERDFVNYLLHYYRINNKYKLDKKKIVNNSLLALAFESNNNILNSNEPLEEFEFFKVEAILEQIDSFFKKHKNSKKRDIDYVSQGVKYRLNLQKNLKELNKTRIHQKKSMETNYSLMATITVLALKLYIQKKSNLNKKLQKKVKKLYSNISKKFIIDKKYTLNLYSLMSRKTTKIFQKNIESKILLGNIRSLFGYEHFYQDNKKISIRYNIDTEALFINSSNFYEWYLYDILKDYANNYNLKIEFDKDKENNTKIKYYLNNKEKSSNPDFVITDENKKIKIVLDAKWKIIDKNENIDSSDYLKLKFDKELQEYKGYGVVSYLIYPKIDIEDRKFVLKTEDKKIFDFSLLEIDMDFKDKNNCLDFSYDMEHISQSLEENSKIQQNLKIATNVSEKIEEKRGKVVLSLIKETDRQEEIGENFDNFLIQKSQELISNLNQEIILPEVKEILDDFDNVLEDDSKTFLKSSSTLYAYYRDLDSIDFDYSMPGSGLWKLVELELNTSFIWYIRILQGVCNNNDPWIKICRPNARIFQDLDNGGKVALTIPDKNDRTKLQSVMFGDIKKLLNDNSTIDDFEDFWNLYPKYKNFVDETLPNLINNITTYRNEHAHIKAMNKDKFNELWNLLFRDNIVKLLEFKKDLVDNIKNN